MELFDFTIVILRCQVLSDLVCEMPETEVSKRYMIDRGTVQVIQQLISIVSHMVVPILLFIFHRMIILLKSSLIRSPSLPVTWDFGRWRAFLPSSVSASAVVHMLTSLTSLKSNTCRPSAHAHCLCQGSRLLKPLLQLNRTR